MKETKASAALVTEASAKDNPVASLVCKDPRLGLAKLIRLFYPENKPEAGIHPTAIVGKNCEIDPSVSIGPGCVIGDRCRIGANTVLDANVVLYSDVKIGKNTTIQSSTVIGAEGFGYTRDATSWVRMPHIGGVIIGDGVDIGANTCIDRGFLEDTVIEDDVIIDNLVEIAHNVQIGKHSAITGCVAIAGSARLGKGCLIGGAASIAGHIELTR